MKNEAERLISEIKAALARDDLDDLGPEPRLDELGVNPDLLEACARSGALRRDLATRVKPPAMNDLSIKELLEDELHSAIVDLEALAARQRSRTSRNVTVLLSGGGGMALAGIGGLAIGTLTGGLGLVLVAAGGTGVAGGLLVGNRSDAEIQEIEDLTKHYKKMLNLLET